MSVDRERSARGVVIAVVALVLLVIGVVVLPMVFARVAPESVDVVGDRIELAEQRMESAERAYESEGAGETGGGRVSAPASGVRAATGDGETVTPAASPPEVHVVVADPNAKIVGVWLRAKPSAPKPVAFDQSSDSVTARFLGTGEARDVPMSSLFAGGSWTLAPGRTSSEHRLNCPRGYRGTVEVEFLHISESGGRVSVTERVEVY